MSTIRQRPETFGVFERGSSRRVASQTSGLSEPIPVEMGEVPAVREDTDGYQEKGTGREYGRKRRDNVGLEGN